MALPLAHIGHWWSYFLYAVPLAVVIASIVITRAQDRRAEREGAGSEEPKRPGGRD